MCTLRGSEVDILASVLGLPGGAGDGTSKVERMPYFLSILTRWMFAICRVIARGSLGHIDVRISFRNPR